MDQSKALKDDTVRKTLSRNEMYTPLVAYEQAKANSKSDPSKYMSNKNSVPKQLQESTLVSFLESVSKKYHRRYATAKDARNTGSRPISLNDMEGRVIRRAVTLLGHGINASITTTKNSGSEETKQKRSRKKRSWNDVQGHLEGTAAEPSSAATPSSPVVVYLQQLNQAWNRYMKSVLPLGNSSIDFEDQDAVTRYSRAIHKQLGNARDKLELVGAHVQVKECAEKKSLTGRDGIMMAETKNTWTIACVATKSKIASRRRVKKQKKGKSDEGEPSGTGVDPNTNTSQDGYDTASPIVTELILVPKRGSTLDLVVPLGTMDEEKDATDTSGEWILPSATNSIFITLKQPPTL